MKAKNRSKFKQFAMVGLVSILFIGMIQTATAATWKQIINAHLSNFKTAGVTVTYEEAVVKGDYAYVADWSLPGLRILNIANPTAISQVGSCITNGKPYQIEVSGNTAYLRTRTGPAGPGEYWIEYIDITTPASPVRLNNFTYNGVDDFNILGNYVFLTNQTLLICMDMTDRGNPIEKDVLPLTDLSTTCANGTKVYVVDRISSQYYMTIIDTTDVNNLAAMGSVNIGTFWPATVKINGNYAYLAGRDMSLPVGEGGTFKSVDVSDPNNPDELYSLTTGGICCVGIEIVGNTAITGACAQGLIFIDITQPASLNPIGYFKEYQTVACGGAYYAQYPVLYDDDFYGNVILFASFSCGLNIMKADNLGFELDIPGYDLPLITVIMVSAIGILYFKIKKNGKISN
jgi:hypothetical protein